MALSPELLVSWGFAGLTGLLALASPELIGFSVPAQGGTYWNGEAMHSKDYNDLDEVPEAVASTTAAVARNAVHLARTLKNAEYPPYK